MLKRFTADLHIHTCLSPCAELDMTPSAIIKTAVMKGIDIIAITDHNSAENIAAAQRAAAHTKVTVLAGMEICSSEEAHILALFDDTDLIMKLQDTVYKNLMPGENDERRFGDQVVVNEKDEVLDFNKRLLISATSLSAHNIVEAVHSLGGLCIASHVDRSFMSVISQLGFIPDDLNFDAIEMSRNIERHQADILYKDYSSYKWITSSDAHQITDMGIRTTTFLMKEPTIGEMRLALKSIYGRRVEWG